tara:strand:+ start:3154 stop:5478 length:2325 start_codon:yes stop_codon:yes gene_type:complete
MLQKLTFKPGINKDLTRYAGEGSWFDCDKVRFVNGLPQKMGGWVKINSTAFSGVCRSLFNWSTLSGQDLMGIGTSKKLILEEGGGIHNVTPLRISNFTLGSNPFQTLTSGTGTLNVTHTGHGAAVGDTVIFAAAATFDGITAAQINTAHVITQIIDSNNYYIVTTGSSSSGSTAGGGSSVLASYEITVGAATSDSGGLGWGAGLFGGTVSGKTTTTLSGGINDSATTIPLTSATGFDTASTTLSAILQIGDGEMSVASVSGLPWIGIVKIGTEQIKYENVDTTNNKISSLTRGFNGTTEAAHSSSASVTYVGTIVIDNEIITYTGVSTNDLTSAVRGQLGTDNVAHDSGATVVESNEFVGWGSGVPVETGTTETITVRLWRQDNFGEDLLANIWGGGIYYWDASSGFGNRAVELSSLSGSSGCPTAARVILVSDNDRHVVALGTTDLSSGGFDPLLIRWGDQESLTQWTPSTTNTAGDLRINNGSEIITALENRQEILVWTDRSLHSLRFVGSPFIFGQTLLSQNVTIIGPNAHVAVGDTAFWMGTNNFYAYDGRVTSIPCSVRNFVFQNMNFGQRNKFFAGSNYEFGEVIWFYVSSDATEIDKYVIYNFVEKAWYTGSLERTAWIDRSQREFPNAASSDGFLYSHDNGFDDGSQNPPAPITAFIESSDFEIGDGDRLQFASRVIPDLSFNGSSASAPAATFSFLPRNFPGQSFGTSSSSTVTASQTVDVEQFTEQAFIRLRGREMSVKVQSTEEGVFWRLGAPRIDIRPDGRR